MEKMIAYCGLTCTEYPALLATQQDDDSQRAQVAEMWSKEFELVIKPEDINCDGCLSASARLFAHCRVCEISKCAQQRRVQNCAHCDDYACQRLTRFFATVPGAKATLDQVRAGL